MKTLKNKTKKGFTIVELVIVIAVIAILAAVLIPTFTGVVADAREAAAKEECRNEWVNFLAENITDTDFDGTTYYVTYDEDDNDTIDYYFVVEDGVFDADGMVKKGDKNAITDFSSGYKELDESTYTCQSSKVKIYTSSTDKNGEDTENQGDGE